MKIIKRIKCFFARRKIKKNIDLNFTEYRTACLVQEWLEKNKRNV